MTRTSSAHTVEVSGELPPPPPNTTLNTACSGPRCYFSAPSTKNILNADRSTAARKLWLAIALCVAFMAAEVGGGIKANSLAILTDAAHLLTDVAGFSISLFSLWASGWDATPRQSFGFFRIEILGTLLSIQLIWLVTGILIYEAIKRIVHGGHEVHGLLMFIIAACGLLVNLFMAILLGHHTHEHDRGHRDGDHRNPDEESKAIDTGGEERNTNKSKRNINVQSAYLHVLGDTIQSIGVMIGGGIIWRWPHLKIVDLICTLLFSVLVLATTVRMLRSILSVLMESTPREIDAGKVEAGLLDMEGVEAVHELHIWAITVGKVLMSCHVKIAAGADADSVLNKMIDAMRREHGITHVTIQIER